MNLDEGRETIWLRKGIKRVPGGGWTVGDLKTHQQRRIALDPETAGRAQALGEQLPADAFAFSSAPDGSSFLTPDSVTQRYDRMATRLGINTTIHKLRHYSATELILSGVDIRTVAGRLGHGSGGSTTLRAYTAWVSEADQRSTAWVSTRMPSRHLRHSDLKVSVLLCEPSRS